MIKPRRIKWGGHVVRERERRGTYRVLMGET
jgi:hypothetical protein